MLKGIGNWTYSSVKRYAYGEQRFMFRAGVAAGKVLDKIAVNIPVIAPAINKLKVTIKDLYFYGFCHSTNFASTTNHGFLMGMVVGGMEKEAIISKGGQVNNLSEDEFIKRLIAFVSAPERKQVTGDDIRVRKEENIPHLRDAYSFGPEGMTRTDTGLRKAPLSDANFYLKMVKSMFLGWIRGQKVEISNPPLVEPKDKK